MRPITVLLLLLVPVALAAAPLTLVRTLGADDEDLLLHDPMSLAYAADGAAYVLNAGECQVLRFGPDWSGPTAFGRCGNGPGEFENPVGMLLEGDEVWVFEMARIVVFGLDGTWRRVLKHENTYASPRRLDGRMVVLLGTGDAPAAYLDTEGRAIDPFGPDCPDDFFEAFKTCRNLAVLPHDEGRCLMVNLVDGLATLVGPDGRTVWERNLIDHEDDSRMETEDDGESKTMTLSLSLGIGRGCRDAQGRYWFPDASTDENEHQLMHVFGPDLKPLVPAFPLPEGVQGWEMVPTPDGRMVLLSPGDSAIHVFEVDPALPTP